MEIKISKATNENEEEEEKKYDDEAWNKNENYVTSEKEQKLGSEKLK